MQPFIQCLVHSLPQIAPSLRVQLYTFSILSLPSFRFFFSFLDIELHSRFFPVTLFLLFYVFFFSPILSITSFLLQRIHSLIRRCLRFP